MGASGGRRSTRRSRAIPSHSRSSVVAGTILRSSLSATRSAGWPRKASAGSSAPGKRRSSHIDAVVSEVTAICARYGVTRLISDQHTCRGRCGTSSRSTVSASRSRPGRLGSKTRRDALAARARQYGTDRASRRSGTDLRARQGAHEAGRDEIETPRTSDSHCDLALSVAACVLDRERHAPASAEIPVVSPYKREPFPKVRILDGRRQIRRGVTWRDEPVGSGRLMALPKPKSPGRRVRIFSPFKRARFPAVLLSRPERERRAAVEELERSLAERVHDPAQFARDVPTYTTEELAELERRRLPRLRGRR